MRTGTHQAIDLPLREAGLAALPFDCAVALALALDPASRLPLILTIVAAAVCALFGAVIQRRIKNQAAPTQTGNPDPELDVSLPKATV